MRKTIFSVLMCCVAIVSVSSSSLLAQGQQNEIKVLERAEELVGAMYHGDAGKVWDVMTPWTRAEVSRRISREEYIKTIEKLSEGWYWQKTNLVCDYMPSANEIKRLTKNLK